MRRHDDAETIGLLYDAAVGTADWRTAGQRLADAVEGATLTLTAQYDAQGGVDLIDMQGVTAKEVELYAAHFVPHDVWRNAAIERRIVDKVILGTDLVSDQDYRNSVIYSDLCRPHTDIFHGVMVTGTLPAGGVFSLGIHRPRMAKPFTNAATQKLEGFLPHLRRAVLIRSRLGLASSYADMASAVLDQLPFGVAQLTAAGHVVSANQAAQRILRGNDGFSLSKLGVRAASTADDAKLQRAIRVAATVTAGMEDAASLNDYLRITRPSGRQPYAVIISPLGLNRIVLSPRQPAVLVMLTDPEDGPRLDERALVALFDLTPAESRVVGLLVMGKALPAIARELGIGFETARTHLARARAKTGTTSQVDLVRTVLNALLPSPTSQEPDRRPDRSYNKA